MTRTDSVAPRRRRTVLLALLAALCLCWLNAGMVAAQAQAPPDAPAAESAAPEGEAGAPPPPPAATAPGSTIRFYANPLWLLLVVVSICFWLYIASWAGGDARGIGMDYPIVTTVMLAVGWVGLMPMLLFHAAFGFLMIIMVLAAYVVYIVKRNEHVPEQHRLFGAQHMARIFGGIPVLNKLATLGAGATRERMAVPLVNQAGKYLSELLEEQPAYAQPVAILADLVVRAYTTQTRKVRFVATGDHYVSQFLMDGVVHNVESVEGELGQQVMACASLFLGLTSEGRLRQGSSKITAEMAGGEKAEIGAQIVAVEGKPALVLNFPNWTADLHKKGLEALGVHPAVLKRLQTAATQQRGAIVVCGPPGSGKTTTLYGITGLIDIFTTDVLAVEKTAEYDLESIRRWPLPQERTITDVFPEILREGPQAIMFGEIESADAASLLLKYAVEEGLALTTMRAPDAAAALLALKKMTGDGDLVGRAVSCVICQRLVRKLCRNCREEVEPNPALIAKLKLNPEEPGLWYRPVGCAACLDSGFRGQTGIFEMLIVTEPVSKAIAGAASASAIRKAAGDGALRSMYQDGLTKVTAGITTLEEIRRVLKQPAGAPAKKGESQ